MSEHDSMDDLKPRLRFDRTINAGQVMQAAVLICTIILTVSTAWFNLRGDLDVAELKIARNEKDLAGMAAENRDFREDVLEALKKIEILLANKADR